jgi:type III secretion protein W
VGESVGGGVSPLSHALAQQLARMHARQQAQMLRAIQIASARSFKTELSEGFNPFSANQKIESKALQQRRTELAAWQRAQAEQKVKDPEQAAAMAGQRERNNPEMSQRELLILRNWVLTGARTAEEILNEVLRYFHEPSIADEVLEYLLHTTSGTAALRIAQARELLRARYAREVAAGRNIGADSRTFATKGIGAAAELRALYLDVTGELPGHNALFEKLSTDYDFPQLKDVVEFLLRSLGSDLRAEGPSIARGKLYWLVTEVRLLQSVLGIYNFFLSREKLVERQFYNHGLAKPEALDFQALAKAFMKLVEDRYPSSVKLLRLARELAIEEELLAEIIVFSQFRDAVRGVSPRIYRSLKHRYDLLTAIVETLEELEEQLEEEEGTEEEEEQR